MFVVRGRLVYHYYSKEIHVCEVRDAVLAQHMVGPDCQPRKNHNNNQTFSLLGCDDVLWGE
jgi:hypothetical protein